MTTAPASLSLAKDLSLYQGLPEDAAAREAVLRRHLAEMLGCAPQALEFHRSASGKPALTAPEPRLRFNTSRRGDLLLIGTAWDCPVGVDLELTPPEGIADAVGGALFSAAEARWLDSLNEAQRPQGFLLLWTAKEAVLKGLGLGIVEGLNDPDLSPFLTEGEPLSGRPISLQSGGQTWQLEWFSTECVRGRVVIARACG